MMRFEWDDAKAWMNRKKHGISFEIAQYVFDDADALMEQDRIEGGERRWQTIGRVGGTLVLGSLYRRDGRKRAGRNNSHHFGAPGQPRRKKAL